MNRSLEVAKVIDNICQLSDTWEIPVTANQLAKIYSVSRPKITSALKHLTNNGVLYSEYKGSSLYYFPTSKKPECLIQEYLCGRFK